MALEAADMVTWEWDLRTGAIRYSENVADLARGEDIERFNSDAGLLRVIHPADRGRLARALKRTRTEGCPFECEYRVRMLDGRFHWILGKGKTVLVQKGRPVRVLGISQDITVRKQAEEELQRRSSQLAKLASELALVEHRERRRLAEIIHEDLQQSLVAASLEAEAVAVDSRAAVRRRGRALLGILSEARAITRGMTQRLAPPVSLRDNLPAAFDWLARHMLTRHKLAVTTRMDASVKQAPESFGVLLFTAARELLLNVVKHAGRRSARIALRRQAGALVLEVTDKGKGIRLHAGRRRGAMPGFGLFSIRERAELLGGTLTVEPAAGRGTRVVLSLPLPREKNPPRASRTPGARHRRPPPAASGKLIRLVVADDHRTMRKGIISFLRGERGFQVVGEADNGKQAVARVRQLRPDVVLMDVRMPVMDGIEAARIITTRWPEVKVVGLSMYEEASVARRMRAAGAAAFVPKSAAPGNLIRAIRSCAARRAPARDGKDGFSGRNPL